MAYVTPASAITVYKNVPLDNTYQHTIYFGSTGAQSGYFSGLIAHTYTGYTYQRKEQNVIRVNELAENLYDCNYLSFQNRGGKTFYCFITGCEYVSEACTALTFEIDPFQTYMRDYVFGTCYVVRMHSTTDVRGDNITPEPVGLGDYKNTGKSNLTGSSIFTGPQSLGCIVAICDTEEGYVNVNSYDGIYQGCTLWACNEGDAGSLRLKLDEYIEKPEAVIAIYMCPEDMIYRMGGPGELSGGTGDLLSELVTLPTVEKGTQLGSYTPKNAKCYTYPYTYLMIDNHSGQSLNLRYEFFNGVPRIALRGTISYPPKITLNPAQYGAYDTQDNSIDYTQCIALENYPQCSWACDTFANWAATAGVSTALSAGANAITGAAVGQPIGAISAVSQVTSFVSQMYQASIAADMCRGTAEVGNVNCAGHHQYFSYATYFQNEDQMRVIDDYFTRFGYAQNKIMSPVLNARPCWTYIQTAGCSLLPLNGMPPADAQATIKSAMDRGMTWWQSDVTIGDYSQDNSI